LEPGQTSDHSFGPWYSKRIGRTFPVTASVAMVAPSPRHDARPTSAGMSSNRDFGFSVMLSYMKRDGTRPPTKRHKTTNAIPTSSSPTMQNTVVNYGLSHLERVTFNRPASQHPCPETSEHTMGRVLLPVGCPMACTNPPPETRSPTKTACQVKPTVLANRHFSGRLPCALECRIQG
jgi:hypothetical protein